MGVRFERHIYQVYQDFVNMFYPQVKNTFISVAKAEAKENYGIEITHELEKLMEAAYKIGFTDAMYFGVGRDNEDEPCGE